MPSEFLIEHPKGRAPRGRFVLLPSILVALLFSAHPQAQTRYAPQPAVLTEVSTTEADPGETQILLTFSPRAPKYSIIRNNTDKPAIAFALSSRGNSAKLPSALHGFLRSITVDQEDRVLILDFSVTSKARVTVTSMGDKVISLSVGVPTRTVGSPSGLVSGASANGIPKHVMPKPGEDEFEVIPLKYADVSEVVGLLTEGVSIGSNDVFTPTEPAFGSAGVGGSTAYAPVPVANTESEIKPLGQSVNDTIGIDRRLNAIILMGSPDLIARLKEKIAKLDVPVTSVVLETIFVELSETGARNVGIDFNNANSQIGVITYTSGSFNALTFGTSAGQISASLQAAVYAQVQKGEGRIISKPRIAAQSGSTAKIVTGDALPILTSIALSGVNAVSQQVQYVNVGVTLQIAPRVTEDGFVTSHIFCEVSSVTGVSQGYPTISQREATTSATVKDGESFVIGGLTQENKLSTHSKIPLLGDVPLLGELFNLDKSTESKTDLYIVITPHIVKRIGSATGDASGVPSSTDNPAPLPNTGP